MASVRNISGDDRDVPWLGRVVNDGEVAEVPDADYESYVCQPTIWEGVDEPAIAGELKGSELKAAVEAANAEGADISASATADEKRAALADWQAAQSESEGA